MKYELIVKELPSQVYDGSQLHSFFGYEQTKERGDSVVFFSGPMQLSPNEMIDMEDVIANDRIWSPLALNFIIEMYHINIETAVLYQRAFMQSVTDRILIDLAAGELQSNIDSVELDGDDVMVTLSNGEVKKASVSIASISHISGLMHVGINISTDAAIPVPAIGLSEIYDSEEGSSDHNWSHWSHWSFAVIGDFEAKVESIKNATMKVKGL